MKPADVVSEAEVWTSQSMRVGVTAASLLIAGGFLLLLLRQGEASAVTGVAGTMSWALSLNGPAIINLGLMVLIGTSVFRVAAAAIAFIVEHDYPHAIISGTVLLILVVSLAAGKVE